MAHSKIYIDLSSKYIVTDKIDFFLSINAVFSQTRFVGKLIVNFFSQTELCKHQFVINKHHMYFCIPFDK